MLIPRKGCFQVPGSTSVKVLSFSVGSKNARQIEIVRRGAFKRGLISGICVTHHACRGVVAENTFNPPVGIFCAVAANHHAGMLGEPHADTAAMVKRHPGRTGRRIQQGVQ